MNEIWMKEGEKEEWSFVDTPNQRTSCICESVKIICIAENGTWSIMLDWSCLPG